jgi:hypothetical protein
MNFLHLLIGCPGIELMLDFYRSSVPYAFNLGIFFRIPVKKEDSVFFCSLIARINPNQSSASDSSAMERLHLER